MLASVFCFFCCHVTAINIVLGLMPYLDNFAHIGGMVMGFWLGLGLLVQRRIDERGNQLDTKCYQVKRKQTPRFLLINSIMIIERIV